MTDVIELIENDHRDVEDLFAKFGSTGEVASALQICADIERHATAEERAVYPVIATGIPNGRQMAGEGEDEHNEARRLIEAIRRAQESDALVELMEALEDVITHHVDAEEAEVLPQARAVLEPEHLEALGREFEAAKAELGGARIDEGLMGLSAFALNCSLKSSTESSSTEKLIDELLFALKEHGVSDHGTVRLADQDVRPGVTSDEGAGDDWPALRRKILDADIFVLGTPIWLGHPSSYAQRVLERLDAFLGEQGPDGRMITLDRVALVAVVGNEDGAHHVAAELFQGLNDVGFTIPANGMTYWVGEAMQSKDYRDLPAGSSKTHAATKLAAAQGAHLARILAAQPYPAT